MKRKHHYKNFNEQNIIHSKGALPMIALVGRPNVGKSTLFNQLIGEKEAIVEDFPGVTRDRHYSEAEINQKLALFVDTGGFETHHSDEMMHMVKQQAQLAIEEADFIILVVDVLAGVQQSDFDIAKKLHVSGKPFLLCVNKVDSVEKEFQAHEFYRLHSKNIVTVSAKSGFQFADLKNKISDFIDHWNNQENNKLINTDSIPIDCHIAVLGRPNVGKSSLINCLLGENRLITSSVAGTTRDSIDSYLNHHDKNYCIIDTAGLRRKSRISDKIENFMVMSALKSLERADIAILMLDATQYATDQDAKIASLCVDRGKGLIVAINKWDLEHKGLTSQDYIEEIIHHYPFLSFARIIYLSAHTGQGMERLFQEIDSVNQEQQKQIQTAELNKFFENTVNANPPTSKTGGAGKVYYAVQTGTKPPYFTLYVNNPDRFSDNYIRFLINSLYKAFNFSGVPIKIKLKGKQKESVEIEDLTDK